MCLHWNWTVKCVSFPDPILGMRLIRVKHDERASAPCVSLVIMGMRLKGTNWKWLVSIHRICLNISPGFYFLPGSGNPASKRDQPYLGPASIKYLLVPTIRSTRKWPYKPHNRQFPWTFQPSPQLRNVEKAGLQIATTHEHSLQFDLVDDWPDPFVMFSIRWTATPTAVTQRLLTWEPSIPPASKRDQHLFRVGFYLSKYSTCTCTCTWLYNSLV